MDRMTDSTQQDALQELQQDFCATEQARRAAEKRVAKLENMLLPIGILAAVAVIAIPLLLCSLSGRDTQIDLLHGELADASHRVGDLTRQLDTANSTIVRLEDLVDQERQSEPTSWVWSDADMFASTDVFLGPQWHLVGEAHFAIDDSKTIRLYRMRPQRSAARSSIDLGSSIDLSSSSSRTITISTPTIRLGTPNTIDGANSISHCFNATGEIPCDSRGSATK